MIINFHKAELALPIEPDVNCLEPVTKIRFRKPTGEFIERLFTLETKLKVMFNLNSIYSI